MSALALAGFAFACRENFVAAGNSRGAVIFVYAFLTDMLARREDETSALMMIALLSVAGIYAYRHNYPRLLNVSTVLIALRFFGVYLEVFGSILSTGMGLIVSGLAFAAIAVVWQKVRRRLLHNVGEKNHD